MLVVSLTIKVYVLVKEFSMQMPNCFEVFSSELYMRNRTLKFAFRQMRNSSLLIQWRAAVTGIKPNQAAHFCLRIFSDDSTDFYSIQLLLVFTHLPTQVSSVPCMTSFLLLPVLF